MNYEEAMNYIVNTAKFGSNYGLSRTEKILELLGAPHKKIKFVHVAGTNGKGSTTAMITGVLRQAGYKVGMYTSPYLEEFEERIQINGINISKDELALIVSEVKEAVDKVIDMGFEHPTEFEIITAAGFLYFYKQKVDYAVIEVGLGGRLDSTNVITPMVSVITSISYDHMAILGDTLEKIAYEKAGIIKKGVPVVVYPQPKEAAKVIEKISQEMECNLIKVKQNSVKLLQSEYTQKLLLNTENDKYEIELSLIGKHQLLNCAVAVNTLEVLQQLGIKIKKEHILEGLKKISWIGRLEILRKEPLVVIDGAHNIDGITNLVESIKTYFKYNRMFLILGILADKQVEQMIKLIAPMAEKIIAVTPHSDRAELAQDLEASIKKYNQNCIACEDYKEAYERALSYCEKGDLLIVSGSLYMIGDMRKIIKKH